MTSKSIMRTVQKTLEELGLHFTSNEKEEQLPYEACIVDFGADEKERPVAVQLLHYSQDLLSAIHEGKKEPNSADLSILACIMTIPCEIPQETAGEVVRLICLANKSIPLGGLNYSEIEKSVYYTYSIPLFHEPPDQMTLLAVLQTASFVKETFLSVIDDVAAGKTTVNRILERPEPSSSKGAAAR
jgi:hypothetical protein